MKKYVLLAGATIVFAAPAYAQTTVPFINIMGEESGTVTLTEAQEGGVTIALDLHDLTPGEHAIHFHQKGACAPAETFDNAGPHLNPFDKEHGKMSEHGAHAGDMDNIVVGEDGTLKTSFVNPHVTLSTDNTDHQAALLDADGSALIIHGGVDDYKTQPAGDAGNRFACAEIKK